MKAENTTMTKDEINRIANTIDVNEYPTSTQYWEAIITALVEAQSEISFKAGIKEATDHLNVYCNKCGSLN